MAQKKSMVYKDFQVLMYSGIEFSAPEKEEVISSFGNDLFKMGEEWDDKMVERILYRLKSCLRTMDVGDLVPYLKKKAIVGESEELALKDAEYDWEEKATRLLDFLIYKGPLALAALYLSLGVKNVPSHYLLQRKFRSIVRSEIGTSMDVAEDKENSTHDLRLDIDEPLEVLDSIPLSEPTANLLVKNFSLPMSRQSNLPTDVGGVVRVWLGRRGRKEMKDLVEALVFTHGLGQYTIVLADEEENYTIPLDILRFFLSLTTVEWHKIAVYLGFNLMFLDSLQEHHRHGNNEDVVTSFLRHWRLPECRHCFLPMLHQLKVLAGVVEETKGKRPLSEMRPDLEPVVYKNKKLKIDMKGTPHKRLECSRYMEHTSRGPSAHAEYGSTTETTLGPEYVSTKLLSGDEGKDGQAQHSSSDLSEGSCVISNWGITERPVYNMEEERDTFTHRTNHAASVSSTGAGTETSVSTVTASHSADTNRASKTLMPTTRSLHSAYTVDEAQEEVLGLQNRTKLGVGNLADVDTVSNSFDAVRIPVRREHRESLDYVNDLQVNSTTSHAEEASNVAEGKEFSPVTGRVNTGGVISQCNALPPAAENNISVAEDLRIDSHPAQDVFPSIVVPTQSDEDDDNINNFDSDSDEVCEGVEKAVDPAGSRGGSNYDLCQVDLPSLSSSSAVLVSSVNCGVVDQNSSIHSSGHLDSIPVAHSGSIEDVGSQSRSSLLAGGEGQVVEVDRTNSLGAIIGRDIDGHEDEVRHDSQADLGNELHRANEMLSRDPGFLEEQATTVGRNVVVDELPLEHDLAHDQFPMTSISHQTSDSINIGERNQDCVAGDSEEDTDDEDNWNKFDTDSDDQSSTHQQADKSQTSLNISNDSTIPPPLDTGDQPEFLDLLSHPCHSQQTSTHGVLHDSGSKNISDNIRTSSHSNNDSSSSSNSFPDVNKSSQVQQHVEPVTSDEARPIEQSVEDQRRILDRHEDTSHVDCILSSHTETPAEVTIAAHSNDTASHLSLPSLNPSFIAANPTIPQEISSLSIPNSNAKVLPHTATGYSLPPSTHHPISLGTTNTSQSITTHDILLSNSETVGDTTQPSLDTRLTTHHAITHPNIHAQVVTTFQDKDNDNLNDFDSSSENDEESLLESGKLLNDFLEIPIVLKPSSSIAVPIGEDHEKPPKLEDLQKKEERSLPVMHHLNTEFEAAPLKTESKSVSVEEDLHSRDPNLSGGENRETEDPTMFPHVPSHTEVQGVSVEDDLHFRYPNLSGGENRETEDPTMFPHVPSHTEVQGGVINDSKSHEQSSMGSSTNLLPVLDQAVVISDNAGLDNICHTESQDSDSDNINAFDSDDDDDEDPSLTSTTVFGRLPLPGVKVERDHMDVTDNNEVLMESAVPSLDHDTAMDDDNSNSQSLTRSQEEGAIIGSTEESHTELEAGDSGLNNFDSDSSQNIDTTEEGNLGPDNNQLRHESGAKQNVQLPQVVVVKSEGNTEVTELAVVEEDSAPNSDRVSVGEDDEDDNLNRFDTDNESDCNHSDVNNDVADEINSTTVTSKVLEGDTEAVDDKPLYINSRPIVMVMLNGKKKLDLAGVEIEEEDISKLEKTLMRFPNLEVLDLSDSGVGLEGAVSLSRALKYCEQLEEFILNGNMVGSNGLSALCNGLRYCNKLKKLVLSDNSIGSVGITSLSNSLRYFINIETLDLSDNAIDEDGVIALADILKHCERLVSINLSCNRINTSGVVSLADGLQFSANLQTVSLSCINVDSEGISVLANCLKNCNSISNLDISCNKIDCSGADAIADGLKYWPKLKNLNLSSNEISSQGAASLGEALVCCVNLEVLSLSSNAMDAEAVQSISYGLRSCTSLQLFQISSNYFGSAGMVALSGALIMCTEIRVLELSHNGVDCDGIVALANTLSTCVHICELNLSYNNIGSEGAVALADAFKLCPRLAILKLSNNHIDSRGAFGLASALKFSNALTLLNLSHNNIGISGLEALKEVIKSCKSMKMLELAGNTEPVLMQTLKQSYREVLQEPHSYSERRASGRNTLTEDIEEQHGKNSLNDFDSQSDEEVSKITLTKSTQNGVQNLRPIGFQNDSSRSDASSDKRATKTATSSSSGHQERESFRTETQGTRRRVHSGNELNDLSGDGAMETGSSGRLSDVSHNAKKSSSKVGTQSSGFSDADLLNPLFTRNIGANNVDIASSAEAGHSDGDSSEYSHTNNLGSSDQFRSLDSNNSVSPPQDNADEVVTKFSNASGRRPSTGHSEVEGKGDHEKQFDVKERGEDSANVSVSGGVVDTEIAVSSKVNVSELEDEDADVAAAESASVKSKESSNNPANLEGSLSAASVPTVFSGNEGKLMVQKSTRKVVSDTGRLDTGTESESGRKMKRHLFRPVGQDHLSSSLPVHLDHVSQQRADKLCLSKAAKFGKGSSATSPGKGPKGKKRSSRSKETGSGSDSDEGKISGAGFQGREKSEIPSVSGSVAPGVLSPSHPTRSRKTSNTDVSDSRYQESVSGLAEDAVSTQKESNSQATHCVSTEEEGMYKFSSTRQPVQTSLAEPRHFEVARTHERSYTPVSDDIGDEGSDNHDDFDSDGLVSEHESTRDRGIHIKSNSELYLDGLSTQGSPDSKSGVQQQSGKLVDRDSASTKNESIDGTHFYQAVPPPIISHVLESSYGQGVLVPKPPGEELDRKSLASDQAANGSEKTKSAPKVNTASRSGYLDNILAPEVYGEVNSENNLSAEDEEGRVMERHSDSSSELEDTRSERGSDGSSVSGFPILRKIKNGNARVRRTTDMSDSDSVHSRRSRRKPKSKNVKKLKDHSGGNASGNNSDNSVDQPVVVKPSSVASASVTESMTLSQSETGTGVWEGPMVSDVDAPPNRLQANGTQPFVPNDAEEMCGEDLMAAIKDPEGLDFMHALISSGAKVNYVYKTGTYPIHQAVCSKNLDKVLMILEHGGDVNIMCREKNKSALHYACEQKLVPIIQVLVLNGADLEAIDGFGMTVLHLKSTLESRDVFSFLLDSGMDINIKHECGVTPLCMAVYSCDIATVRFLLDRGAEPNVSWVIVEKDLTLTPLCLAAVKGNQAMVSLLVEFGAEINSHDEAMYSPVAFAIMGKSVDLVRYFTEQPDFDCTLKGLVTPFCIGVQKKQYECIEIIVGKYRGGLRTMLRDSKRAGYQRLTSYIYEYRQYEVDPRPPPVKEEPTFSEQLVPHAAPPSTQSAASMDHSEHTQSHPAGLSRPMPTFIPMQSNDGTAILVNVLTEFAIIAIQACVGYDEDGPEKLIKHAGMASLSHVESFFVSYFYNYEEYQQTGRLVADFIGSGTPAPMTYLFLAGHVKRDYFEALLAETRKSDLMDRLALALQQFPDMQIPCDGNGLLDALFNMDQTSGNPLGGLTGGGFQFGNSGPYGNSTSIGSNQGQGGRHTGGSGSGSMGSLRQQLSAATGANSSDQLQGSNEDRNGSIGGATGFGSSGQRLGGAEARQSRLVTSTSSSATPRHQTMPSLSQGGHIASSAVVVTTSGSSITGQMGFPDPSVTQGRVGESHSSSFSTTGEQQFNTQKVRSAGGERPSLDSATAHLHSDSDIKDRNNLDDGSTAGDSPTLDEATGLVQENPPELFEYHSPIGNAIPGGVSASKLTIQAGGLSNRYDDSVCSLSGSVDTVNSLSAINEVTATDFPSFVSANVMRSQLNTVIPALGYSMYTSPIAGSAVSASGLGAAMSFSAPQRSGIPAYTLKESGVALRQHYEAIKEMYPSRTSECDESLKNYPIPDSRTLFSKEFKTSKWEGQKWIDISDSEWKRLKEVEDEERYDDGLQLSVTSSILKHKETAELEEKVVKETTLKATQSIGLNRRHPSPLQKATIVKPSKSITGKQTSSVPSGGSAGKTPRNVSPRTTSRSVPSRTKTGDKSNDMQGVSSKQGSGRTSSLLTSTRHRRLLETPLSRLPATVAGKPRKRPATEVHTTATRESTKAHSPKSESLNSENIARFFENVDAVKNSPPEESEELFHQLCLDPKVHNKWRMIGRYLFLEEPVINYIDECSSFAEEKCLRMLREWKRSDVSSDYAELVYALSNCGCYSSVENAKPLLPEAMLGSVTIQIPIPIDEETLTKLEMLLIAEKDKGALRAEVILQGKEPMECGLPSMDKNGLQIVKYASIAMAG